MLINTQTKKPVYEYEFRKQYSKTIFPKELTNEILKSYNYAVLNILPTPEYDSSKYILKKEIVLIENTWTQQWILEPIEYSIEELKKFKLTEINDKYNTATSALVATYPETELLTFDKQEQEARAWLEDNSTETLLVDALAEGRQIEKADLVNRIISKADLFATQTGYLTGQRQYYEDQLDLAQTKEEIEAIVPEYKYYEVGEVNVEA